MFRKIITGVLFAAVFGTGILANPSSSEAGYRRRCCRTNYRCLLGRRAACRRAARRCCGVPYVSYATVSNWCQNW